MAGEIFWRNQFEQARKGEKPTLTIEQEEAKEQTELELQGEELPSDQGITTSDVGKSAVSGVLGWGESMVELDKVAKKLPLPGKQYEPLLQNVFKRFGIDDPRQQVVDAAGDWLSGKKEQVRASMGEDARKALQAEIINENLTFTDDAAKWETWVIKGTETAARMVPDIVAGGLGPKGVYDSVFQSIYKAGLGKGFTEKAAKIAADKVAKAAMSAPTTVAATASATGGSGVQIRETIEGMSWRDLMESDTFKNNFRSINDDPQYAELSNAKKLDMARSMTADQASQRVMQNPALLAANVAASFIGDATLGKLVTGKLAGSAAGKITKGIISEAPTEAGQGAMEQYVQNLELIETAGQDIDPTEGVLKSAVESGVMGAAMGGGFGATGATFDAVSGRKTGVEPPATEEPEALPVTEPEPTVTERREALQEKISQQRVEAGIGEVQEALKKEPAPTPEQLIQQAAEQQPVEAEPEVEPTVAERRDELQARIDQQRVEAGLGEVQEALQRETAPTPEELIRQAPEQQAPEQVAIEPEIEPEVEPTVAERRDKLQARINQQRVEAGLGEIQERLSRPAAPSVEEIIAKAPKEAGPTPYELEYRRQSDREYLDKAKDAKISAGLKGKPGASRMMNKGYRNAISDFGKLAKKVATSKVVDPKVDTMSEAIAKMGGLDRTAAEAEGFDPAAFKRNKAFPAKGKLTFDHAAEVLNEQGYRNREGGQLTANDVVDMVSGETNNQESHFSIGVDPDMLTADADMMREWSRHMGGADKLDNAINKAMAGEKLGKRQAEVIEEMIDTIHAIRSDDVEAARETLTAKREARRNQHVEEFNQRFAEALDQEIEHFSDYEHYSNTMAEMPDHYTQEQAILDELVVTAGDRDYGATEGAIRQYEDGEISLPTLLDQLGEISSRKPTYAEAKPRIQTTDQPATQPTERVTTERVEAEPEPTAEPEPKREPARAEEPTAEPAAEPEPARAAEPEPAAEPESKPAEPRADQAVAREEQAATERTAEERAKSVDSIETQANKSKDGNLSAEDVKTSVDNIISDRETITEDIKANYSKEDLIKLLGPSGEINASKSKDDLADLYVQKVVNDTLNGGSVSITELGKEGFDKVAKERAEDYEQPEKTEDPQILFSKETTPESPKGMPAKEIQLAADVFVKSYNGAADVVVKVFQTQKEATDYLGIPDDPSSVLHAMYNPRASEVVLVSDNFNNAHEVTATLRHEILAHHGLMQVVGQAEWKKIIEAVQASRDTRALRDIWDQIDRDYAEFGEDAKAEEVIAKIAEHKTGVIGKWRDKIIALIVRAMRKVKLLTGKITKAEVNNLIGVIEKRMINLERYPGYIRNDIKFSKQGSNPSGFSIPEETRKDAAIRIFADKFKRLKVIQEAIKKQGGAVSQASDVYLAEELYHGKVGEDLRVIEDDYVKPLSDLMVEKDLDPKSLDLYLIAKHAPERNDYIAGIRPEMPDGGSGMTNQESADILRRFNAEGKAADYEQAAKLVRGLLRKTRDRIAESGLESHDMIASWDAQYKNYVPLKGFAVNEIDEQGNAIKGVGRGFDIRGKESMKALGRRTLADSPTAYAIADATSAVIRARKNEVGQTLIKLIDRNPDPDLWQVFSQDNPDQEVRPVRKKDPKTGKYIYESQVTDIPMALLKDRYFGVKMGGEQYYVKLNDSRLRESMLNLGVEQQNVATQTIGKVNRVLSALITSYNPEFMLSNIARDVQTAVYNVMAETQVPGGKAQGKKIATAMLKKIPGAMGTLRQGLRKNNFAGKDGKYFKEFLEDGAKTGWFVQKDIDTIKAGIERTIDLQKPGAMNKLIRFKDKFFKFVDDYNDIVENASRLSAYIAAREAGVDRVQSASLAKNLTINFNRKGELGSTMNAIYMFFNASIQGTANMLRAVATPKDASKKLWQPGFYNSAQKIALALPVATMAMAAVNRNLGGDDDDGKPFYDKIPDFVKETNFVLMAPWLGDGEYIKIPMPYGYNFFSAIGTHADNVINGKSSPVSGAFDVVSTFFGAFSPLGMPESDNAAVGFTKMISPTLVKPFLELAVNENFTGSPIYKQQSPFALPKPDAYNAQARTWEWAKGLSQFLNDMTGGDQFESGHIDISPEAFEHLTKFVTGGAGTLFGRSQDLVTKVARGKDVESRDIPFFRKYFGNISESTNVIEFYDRADKVQLAIRKVEGLPKPERLKYIAENRGLIKMIKMYKHVDKEMRTLNRKKRMIEASQLSDEMKELRIEKIEEKKQTLTTRFNKKYNEVVEE